MDGGLVMTDWLNGSSYSNTLDAQERSADFLKSFICRLTSQWVDEGMGGLVIDAWVDWCLVDVWMMDR